MFTDMHTYTYNTKVVNIRSIDYDIFRNIFCAVSLTEYRSNVFWGKSYLFFENLKNKYKKGHFWQHLTSSDTGVLKSVNVEQCLVKVNVNRMILKTYAIEFIAKKVRSFFLSSVYIVYTID